MKMVRRLNHYFAQNLRKHFSIGRAMLNGRNLRDVLMDMEPNVNEVGGIQFYDRLKDLTFTAIYRINRTHVYSHIHDKLN